MSVRISTEGLERRLRVAPGKLKRVTRNALNDAARELRKETPKVMDRVIDRPTPFTRRTSGVIYRGASYDRLSASLELSPLQQRYLSPGEFGEASDDIQTPVARDAFDAKGNLKKRYRWTATDRAKLFGQVYRVKAKRTGGIRTVGKHFVGTPVGGGYRQAGLFERSRDGKKLKRITSFTRRRRYRAQFGIRDEWQRLGGPMLRRHLQFQAQHPSNRL